MEGVQMLPVDTLFFRDSVPFSIEGPQVDVGGVFPPNSPTVVGALRAALARENGWNGRGRWPTKLDEVLGDRLNLGRFSMAGPVVLMNGEPLVPVPRHLLGRIETTDTTGTGSHWVPIATLQPGPSFCCDLGDAVRLPHMLSGSSASEEVLGVGEDWWLTRAGLRTLLSGEVPTKSEVFSQDALWTEERRVGLERDSKTRTAKEGMLYSARHVRLQPGVTIGARVDGIPESWRRPWGELIPFGGERRMCELRRWDGELAPPLTSSVAAEIVDHGRLLLVALTPVDLDPILGADIGFPPSLGEVTLVAACVGRPQRIGGWSSFEQAPQPLRSVLPAGSVLFCEAKDPHRLRELSGSGMPPRIGARQAWGYGVVGLGTWSEEREKTAR